MEKQNAENLPTRRTTESTCSIPMRDGFKNELRIVRPENPSPKSPLVVLFHGGAFFNGTNLQLIRWARDIAYLYGATVALPTYRLAPQYKFPVAPQDAYDNLLWLSANAASTGADTEAGFVLGGASAGATVALAAATRSLRENMSPKITGLFLNTPGCLKDSIVPEKYKDVFLAGEQNKTAPVLNEQALELLERLYEPDFLSEEYSPFNTDVDFARFPRTYVQVDGMDILRDDGIILGRALSEAGVDVFLDVYAGCPHGHHVMWPQVKKSVQCQVDVLVKMGLLLGVQIDDEAIQRLCSGKE